MAKAKGNLVGNGNPYKVAAAARRDKVASSIKAFPGEVTPSDGRIRITLSGPPIRCDRQAAVCGPTSIQIPEFAVVRKRKTPAV